LGEGRKPKEKLFLKANGIQWQTSEQFRPMNAACEAAKVEGVTFHILRHTYASHALMAGMTIEVLAQQLGHKDTRITMRHYAHLCPTFKQESIRRYAPSFGFGSAPEPSEAESPSMSASGRRTAKILPIASGY
jgi:integrase